MRVTGDPERPLFPMKIRCRQVKDGYGLAYGNAVDFCGHELEIEAGDVVKHPWYKYPERSGTDYGVICPVCGMFVQLDKAALPASVKQGARQVSLDSGRLNGFEGRERSMT